MIRGIPLVRLRDAKKFATTSITNELAKAVNSLAHGGLAGQIDEPQSVAADIIVLRIDDEAPMGGMYEATEQLGDFTLDGTNAGGATLVVSDGGMTDGDNKILLTNLAEDGSEDHALSAGDYVIALKDGSVPAGDGTPGPYAGWTEALTFADAVGKGTAKYQTLQMVTDKKRGWDWVRFH